MKKMSLVTFVIAFILAMTIPITTQAASKNDMAHDAYNNAMASGEIDILDGLLPYAYFDIDRDGVDELIIYPGYGFYSYGIYSYRSGKVKEMLVLSQAEGSMRLYPKTKMIYCSGGHMGGYYDDYYKVSKGKATLVASRKYFTNNSGRIKKIRYYVKKKAVTKTKYTKYVKTLKKGTKITHNRLKWMYFN